MNTIHNNILNTLIIKKSKFITYLYKVDSINEIDSIIFNLKQDHKDCNHICYAYKIDNIKRFNDDGEPSGTAGMPILNVIDTNNLNHVLFCVIRYFGGIKLGTGGLIRAYTKSITEALKLSNITKLVNGYKVEISFRYDDIKNIDYILKDVNIINKNFNDSIVYTFNISIEDFNDLYQKLKDISILKIKENIFI